MRRRSVVDRKVIAAAVLLALAVGGWLLVRQRQAPLEYYPRDRFLALGNFTGWDVLKDPASPGPYRFIGGAKSMIGESVSGSFRSPAGHVNYDIPGEPGTCLLVAGVVNPVGQLDFFVL